MSFFNSSFQKIGFETTFLDRIMAKLNLATLSEA